jgi:hypothetical protein
MGKREDHGGQSQCFRTRSRFFARNKPNTHPPPVDWKTVGRVELAT